MPQASIGEKTSQMNFAMGKQDKRSTNCSWVLVIVRYLICAVKLLNKTFSSREWLRMEGTLDIIVSSPPALPLN